MNLIINLHSWNSGPASRYHASERPNRPEGKVASPKVTTLHWARSLPPASVALLARKVVGAVLLVTHSVAVDESLLRVAGEVQLDLAVGAVVVDVLCVEVDTLATEERLLLHVLWPCELLGPELWLSGLLPGRLEGLERLDSNVRFLLLLCVGSLRNNASGLAGRVRDGLEHGLPGQGGDWSFLRWLSGGHALSGGGDALRLALALGCGALALLKGLVDASLELAFIAHEANDGLERELDEIAHHLSYVVLANNLLDSRVQQDG